MTIPPVKQTTACTGSRSSGGATITVADGSLFGGGINPTQPCPCAFWSSATATPPWSLVTVLSVVGVSGNTLTLGGPLYGFADAALDATARAQPWTSREHLTAQGAIPPA